MASGLGGLANSMVDLLEQAAEWLDDVLAQHVAQSVTYRRAADPADLTVVLAATPGRSESEQVDDHGSILRTRIQDWSFGAADLLLGGSPAEPRAGDRIEWARNGTTLVFEVMAETGEQPFRRCDDYGKRLRVHTKQVGTG